MSITANKYGFDIDGHWAEIQGKTRLIYPEWCISVDGAVKDSKKKVGQFLLNATVGEQQIVAEVRQNWFGDVAVTVTVGGKRIQLMNGFLL